MKFLCVLLTVFLLSGLCFSGERQNDLNRFEIYEHNLVESITNSLSSEMDNLIFNYGIGTNGVNMLMISFILKFHHRLIEDDFNVVIFGDRETQRPTRVVIYLFLVFDEYTIVFDDINVEEK